jgi:hypothetical protein
MSARAEPIDNIDVDGGAGAPPDVTETLGLMKRFVAMVFTDPSIADDIPAYASVIFLPHDDPALAARNRAAGERMRAAGATVHFVEV